MTLGIRLQELGVSERKVRASNQQEFNATLAANRNRGRSNRIGPDGRCVLCACPHIFACREALGSLFGLLQRACLTQRASQVAGGHIAAPGKCRSTRRHEASARCLRPPALVWLGASCYALNCKRCASQAQEDSEACVQVKTDHSTLLACGMVVCDAAAERISGTHTESAAAGDAPTAAFV